MPLISRVGRYVGSPNPKLALPTQGGMVDLVMGRTLIQAIDFELPFGGAVFRHVRTFGKTTGEDSDLEELGGASRYWDWQGRHWMMGENPILLIDAQPKWGAGPWQIVMPERRCYFIPDAHHAIPFRFDDNALKYVAPPWFDAIMSHDGTLNPDTGAWINRPTEFYVWLNRQSIKYTFRPYYVDLDGVMHDPPPPGPWSAPEKGYPYYALLERVEDRQGNRMEISYCGYWGFEQECCCQSCAAQYTGTCYTCNQKGQTKAVRLITASGQTAWTLLFYHQPFPRIERSLGDCSYYEACDEADYDHLLRSIFVYEGDVGTNGHDCYTWPSQTVCEANELSDWDSAAYPGVPDNWVIQAEYTYQPDQGFVNTTGIHPDVTGGDTDEAEFPLLLRALVKQRGSGATTSIPTERATLYRYAYTGPLTTLGPAIATIFEPQAVDTILTRLREKPPNGVDPATIDSNFVMTQADTLPVKWDDPETGELRSRKLWQLATHRFAYWMLYTGAECTYCNNAIARDAAARYGAADCDQTVPEPAAHTYGFCGGVRRHEARTGDPNVDGIYYYYLLRNTLTGDRWSDQVGWVWDEHVPYYADSSPFIPPADKVRHIAVVDHAKEGDPTCDEEEDCKYDPLDGFPQPDGDGKRGLYSRRVVEMNAQAFVLRDRTFEVHDVTGTFDQASQLGYAEQKVYDENGLLLQVRTEGWGSEHNQNPTEDGLVYFFEYEDADGNGRLDQLWREGVKLGTLGDKYYTAQYDHELPDRPDLVTQTTRFVEPVSSNGIGSVDPADHEVTYSTYSLGDLPPDPLPEDQRPVTYEEHVSSMGPAGESGTGLWAIKRALYDDKGQPTHQGFGIADSDDPLEEDFVEFFYGIKEYDTYGRVVRELIDANSSGAPDDFVRVADAILEPLELTTRYFFDELGRPIRTIKPDLREDRMAYNLRRDDSPPYLYETWKYEDVDFSGGSPSVEKPVQVVFHTWPGEVQGTLKATIDTLNGDFDGQDTYGPEDVVSRTEIKYDEYGRPAGAAALADVDSNGTALEARISYDAFGQVGREQGPDGTITRTTRGMRGRVERVYRGTQDEHVYWGTRAPCATTNGCDEDAKDNMVLAEKWYYGDGVTDAGKVVAHRRYREKPLNQYFVEGPQNPPPANNEDQIGLETEYQYDPRMRQVYVVERGTPPSPPSQEGAPLHYTLTWYDHRDRPRLVAEYGPPPPGSVEGIPEDAAIDPRYFGVTTPLPTAEMILGADPAPLSLTETIYDRAGLVREERTYDVSCAPFHGGSGCATPEYVSVRTDYDGRGLVVELTTPGGPTTKTIYDAKGRPKVIKTVVEGLGTAGSGLEIQRVEKEYDARDNLLKEITYERKAGAVGDVLTAENAVIRYRFYWYNASNQLTAGADYGTNSGSTLTYGPFVNGDPPAYDPDLPPVWVTPALVTFYEYDEAGRQNRITDPGGIVTETQFDDLGRPVLVTENASGYDHEQRHTAYQYDKKTGVLVKVAAVRALDQGEVPWASTNGMVQVTRYEYGAVVESGDEGDYDPVSTNGTWIGAVYYPDPLTGQPEDAASVQFSYRFDGQPARRIDGRGVQLVYGYDPQDLLASIRVAAAPPTGLLAVDTTVDKMSYAHTSDGLLSAARTHGDDIVLSECEFGYGRFRQLVSASQDLPAVTGSGVRNTTYSWITDAAANRYRLDKVVYPEGMALDFNYGSAGDLDDALSRLTGLDVSGTPLASWRYLGLGRPLGTAFENGLSMDYDDGPGGPVTGLDQFGRVIDMPWSSGTPALQYQYDYDKRGNRLFRRAISSELSASSPEIQDSWLYGYDGLSRLVEASRGELNAAGTAHAEGVEPEISTWELDELGNWSRDANMDDVSMRTWVDTDGNGEYDSSYDPLLAEEYHDTNQINEIASRTSLEDLGTNGPAEFAYDGAGNLVFDAVHYFVYDAWNRVVAVYEAGSLEVENGVLVGQPGNLIAKYAYDGLGRRVLSSTGILPVEITRHVYGGGPEVLAEYDVASNGIETLARWFVHGQSFPEPLVMVDVSGSGFQPEGVAEYLYYLKDALGSVVALTNVEGEIVERYFYSPYGETTIASPATALGASPRTAHWHDHDLDGDIDQSDQDDLLACMATTPPDGSRSSAMCVFSHDANADDFVDLEDLAHFDDFTGYNPSGTAPPANWLKSFTPHFDPDADGDVDEYDFSGFQACATSNGVEAGPACRFLFDVEPATPDGDIDAADYAAFAEAFTGHGGLLETPEPRSFFGNPLMWTGQRYDPVTRLYHFLRRTEASILGRWIQQDPRGLALSGPRMPMSSSAHKSDCGNDCCSGCGQECEDMQVDCCDEFNPQIQYEDGMNLYAYVASSPTSATDPYGLDILGLGSLLSSVAIGSNLDAAMARNDIATGFALQRQIMYLLMAGVALDAALDFFPPPWDRRRKKCHCFCVSANPLPGRPDVLHGPISGITDEDDCKRYPFTDEGQRFGYRYCFCK